MTPIAPPYASRFMHLAMSFPSENMLHIEPNRSIFSGSLTEPPLSVHHDTAKIEPLIRIFPLLGHPLVHLIASD